MSGVLFGMGMKTIDKFNGKNTFGELKSAVGKTYTDYKFKVISVNEFNSKIKDTKTGVVKTINSQILYNKLFG